MDAVIGRMAGDHQLIFLLVIQLKEDLGIGDLVYLVDAGSVQDLKPADYLSEKYTVKSHFLPPVSSMRIAYFPGIVIPGQKREKS
jgi:hypothetical protein